MTTKQKKKNRKSEEGDDGNTAIISATSIRDELLDAVLKLELDDEEFVEYEAWQRRPLTLDEARALSSALLGNTHLRTLNLCDCFEDANPAYCDDGTRTGGGGGDEAAASSSSSSVMAFIDTVLLCTTTPASSSKSALRSVDLGNNDLKDSPDARAIGIALNLPGSVGSRLTELYLANNLIGVDGVRSLAKGLLPSLPASSPAAERRLGELGYRYSGSSCLERLDLSHNRNIGDAGCKEIAAVLRQSNLRQLYLMDTGIGDEGAVRLAQDGLCYNPKLEILKLGHNRIGDVGAGAVAAALSKNATLRELYLEDNVAGAETGVAEIVSCVEQHNFMLEVLWCVGNGDIYLKQQQERIDPVLARNAHIKKEYYDRFKEIQTTLPRYLFPRAFQLLDAKPDLLYLTIRANLDRLLYSSSPSSLSDDKKKGDSEEGS